MPQAVIFDVDGTLVDSVDIHAQSWQDAFAEIGHLIGHQAIRDQIGKGGDELMPVFLNEQELAEKGEALTKRRAAILKERYIGQITAFPQVPALLRRLRQDGIRVALASSAKGDELAHYKSLLGIADLLDTETSSDDAERSKPHPDIFQAALARLPGIAPADALVVGDTPYDAQAAEKAGLRTIGVLCGGFPEARLREAGCIAIFRDPADLLARYDQSPFSSARDAA